MLFTIKDIFRKAWIKGSVSPTNYLWKNFNRASGLSVLFKTTINVAKRPWSHVVWITGRSTPVMPYKCW